jgi:hypothetical protein
MKKIMITLFLLLAAVLVAPTTTALADSSAGLPKTKNGVACTYTAPTLHGGQTYTVWSGSQGELVKVTNYIQRITSLDCGGSSYRTASNWKATKNGAPANMGAELGHYVQDDSGNNYNPMAYSCYDAPAANTACFSSSGADGEFSTYGKWFNPWYSANFRGRLSVSQVSVAGRSSTANHVSQSGWLWHEGP